LLAKGVVRALGVVEDQPVGELAVEEGCTGPDYLDTVLQLRLPFAWHKPDGLRGVI
jgi:hypothetical protein